LKEEISISERISGALTGKQPVFQRTRKFTTDNMTGMYTSTVIIFKTVIIRKIPAQQI